ncbi:type VI secretion system lipoprotein TssJ [Paraburkholderia tropica]|uniref:type VI secretion system lipoprotein TssJ n=1 Tax=Paraburkholderia tropica TaxID=92647 RepID=UPI0016036CA3|nr:type VI secretion system lipoprotein TssJ [Paraburkholderia tropica]QNB15894.1 type VI secretion system lipoprotein TssJ [Paraburkholderia tropica]
MLTVITPVLLLGVQAGIEHVGQFSMQISSGSGSVLHAPQHPDDEKRAAPIIVRVYELKNVDAFNASDFFSLQDKDKSVLNDDLVVRDQFQLRPGESKTIQRIADQATTTLGVLAAYRDLPNSVWRATWTLPSAPPQAWYRWGQKVKLTIRLDTNAIKITDEQPQSRK